jgi:nucleotide-binding universal stress UspA family protein
MILRPSVLCPVDFSDASRGALRYAAAVAEHFCARLTVLTINDPVLEVAAVTAYGAAWLPEDSHGELRRFVESTFSGRTLGVQELRSEVATGKPAPEILRVARERSCDLIVMSTHGLTGVRKLFFGSTTERVLRETSVPVLVTPSTDHGPRQIDEIARTVRRVLAPVDLTAASPRQVLIARGIGEAINVPIVLAHVIEPVRFPAHIDMPLPSIEAERRDRAERALAELTSTIPPALKPEALVAYGDPAEEIAKIARDRRAGLVVMGLHASPLTGPRMGSVTYRLLCLSPTLVLALPPVPDAGTSRRVEMSSAERDASPRSTTAGTSA